MHATKFVKPESKLDIFLDNANKSIIKQPKMVTFV